LQLNFQQALSASGLTMACVGPISYKALNYGHPVQDCNKWTVSRPCLTANHCGAIAGREVAYCVLNDYLYVIFSNSVMGSISRRDGSLWSRPWMFKADRNKASLFGYTASFYPLHRFYSVNWWADFQFGRGLNCHLSYFREIFLKWNFVYIFRNISPVPKIEWKSREENLYCPVTVWACYGPYRCSMNIWLVIWSLLSVRNMFYLEPSKR
jgi:hypothetical protein